MIQKTMLERQQQSEAKLQAHGVPVNPHLLFEEDESAFHFQSAQDVAKRALVLYNLLGIIFYDQPEDVANWVKEEGLWPSLSPREREIFEIPLSDLNEGEKVWKQRALQSNRITWRTEALWVLLWALGEMEHLEWPSGQCDAARIRDIMPALRESMQPFIQKAQLRSPSEILDEADLHYRMMWAIQVANEEGKTAPGELEPFTVYERYVALQWLIRGLTWQEIAE